jgi:alcohol dehydrogenase
MIFGLTPFPLPIELGHECVAEVVEGPEPFSPGDRVVVPFQISCGLCGRCRRGLTGNCECVSPRQMYGFGSFGGGWGGMLADLALVPYANAMLVPLPDGLDPALVPSAADNMPDGWRTVACALSENPAADVFVLGGAARSVALYAVDIAMALGAASVTYVDTDTERLRVASELGAKVLDGLPDLTVGTFPITVDGSVTADGLVACLRLTEWGGHCTTIGQMTNDGRLPLWDIYQRGVHLHIGPGMARPAIPAILDLAISDRLRPEIVTSVTVDWEDAPQALLEPTTKLVINRVG